MVSLRFHVLYLFSVHCSGQPDSYDMLTEANVLCKELRTLRKIFMKVMRGFVTNYMCLCQSDVN